MKHHDEEAGARSEAAASLRIMGKELEPDAVSAALRLRPEYSACRGDHLGGDIAKPVHREGIWVWRPRVSASRGVEEHLEAVALAMERRERALHQVLEAPAVRGDVLVGWFFEGGNAGFRLSAALLGRLSKLGLALEFDAYG